MHFTSTQGDRNELSQQDFAFLREVIDESRAAYEAGERPCAALVVSPRGEVLARAWNQVNSTGDFSAHAETAALKTAASEGLAQRSAPQTADGGQGSTEQSSPMVLAGATLYASAEPCAMCSGAAFFAGISRIVFSVRSAKLYERTGRPGQQLWLKTAAVLGSGDRNIDVIGPIFEEEGLSAIGL